MSFTPDGPEYEAMRHYISMTVEKRESKARLKALEGQLGSLQPSLIAYLTAAGITNITIDDHQLVTSRLPNIYPLDGVSRQQVCEALKVAGLNEFVKEDYNLQSLTAYVTQLEEHAKTVLGLKDEDPAELGALRKALHPALASILRLQAKFILAVRNSPRKGARHYAQRTEPTEGAETYDDA